MLDQAEEVLLPPHHRVLGGEALEVHQPERTVGSIIDTAEDAFEVAEVVEFPWSEGWIGRMRWRGGGGRFGRVKGRGVWAVKKGGRGFKGRGDVI